MIDMTLNSEQVTNTTNTADPLKSDGPKYSPCLIFTLGNDELRKLAIGGLPEIGAETTMLINTRVVAASETEQQIEADRSLSFQITGIEIAPDPASGDAPDFTSFD
jgi:hypothetical protein